MSALAFLAPFFERRDERIGDRRLEFDRFGKVGDRLTDLDDVFSDLSAALIGDGEPFEEGQLFRFRELLERIDDAVVQGRRFVKPFDRHEQVAALQSRVEEIDDRVLLAGRDDRFVGSARLSEEIERLVDVVFFFPGGRGDERDDSVGEVAFMIGMARRDEVAIALYGALERFPGFFRGVGPQIVVVEIGAHEFALNRVGLREIEVRFGRARGIGVGQLLEFFGRFVEHIEALGVESALERDGRAVEQNADEVQLRFRVAEFRELRGRVGGAAVFFVGVGEFARVVEQNGVIEPRRRELTQRFDRFAVGLDVIIEARERGRVIVFRRFEFALFLLARGALEVSARELFFELFRVGLIPGFEELDELVNSGVRLLDQLLIRLEFFAREVEIRLAAVLITALFVRAVLTAVGDRTRHEERAEN